MNKIVNPAFRAPPPRNPTPLQQPEYFKRELKSWDAIHLEHEFTADAQRKSRHWLMKADHPEHLHTTLCRIYRVKIRPCMFELDENGTIAPPDKPPLTSNSALIIRICGLTILYRGWGSE